MLRVFVVRGEQAWREVCAALAGRDADFKALKAKCQADEQRLRADEKVRRIFPSIDLELD